MMGEVVRANPAWSKTDRAPYRRGILLVIFLGHVAMIGLLVRMTAKRGVDVPAAVVTFLSLPKPSAKAIPPPPVETPSAPTVDVAAPPNPAAPLPIQRRPKKTASAVSPVPTIRPDPCAKSPAQDEKKSRDPACDAQVKAEPPLQLQLPGGFYQNDQGAIVSNPTSIFANLPPESPDQIRAEADRRSAALERIFGPPPKALTPKFDENPVQDLKDGVLKTPPLIQFIEDRLIHP
jgi:hypothetical protein